MINPQLLNYVRAQRQAGVSKEAITKALAGGGWSAQDAEEAFAAIEGVTVPPQPPRPAPAPAPATKPTPQPQVQVRPVQPTQPVQAMAPQPAPAMAQTSVRIQPQAVVQRTPAYAQVKKRRVWPWLLLLIIFLFGGFAAGAYTAVEYQGVRLMVQNIKNMIVPPTLEPVYEEPEDTTPFEPFVPETPLLGESTATTSTSTAP